MTKKVVVIGAGIGGLTAGALLAKRGYQVWVVDQAAVPGGVRFHISTARFYL